MSDPWSGGFDGNGDPVQHGLHLPSGQGIAYQSGLVLGVVLSVNPADSSDNLLNRILTGDEAGDTKASYIEANVLALFSGQDESMIYQHCIVAPPGKTSRTGPTENEPADFSEDVPNGCRADQVQAIFNGNDVPIRSLTGDWVILQFVGGQTQIPIVTHWFPNPYNSNDTAVIADGKRWRLRRNNTDLLIDKNGDFSLSHRGGNYLQMNGKTMTLKHIEGATVFIDDEGDLTILTPNEVSITEKDGTFSINNGNVVISVNGNDVHICAPSGDVNVVSQRCNVLTEEMNVGPNGGTGLGNEQLAQDVATMGLLLQEMVTAVQGLGGTGPKMAAYLLNLPLLKRLSQPTTDYLTKVLAAE